MSHRGDQNPELPSSTSFCFPPDCKEHKVGSETTIPAAISLKDLHFPDPFSMPFFTMLISTPLGYLICPLPSSAPLPPYSGDAGIYFALISGKMSKSSFKEEHEFEIKKKPQEQRVTIYNFLL